MSKNPPTKKRINGNGRPRLPTTFNELNGAFETRCKGKLCPGSAKVYKLRIGQFCRWAENEDITLDDLKAFDIESYLSNLVNRWGEPLKPGTIHGHARVIRTMLTWAARHEIIEKVKFEMPLLPKPEVVYLSDEQQDELLNADLYARDSALIRLILDTSARLHEALALNWADLQYSEDTEDGTCRIRKGKGGKIRTTYFGFETWAALEYWALWEFGGNQLPTDPVFVSYLSHERPLIRLSLRGGDHSFRKIDAEFPFRIKAHILRHTCGRNLAKAGLPVQAIMNIMGHSDIQMSQRYTSLIDEDTQNLWRAKMRVEEAA